MKSWDKQESWFIKEKTFAVEIKRWSYKNTMKSSGMNNIWHIYVYIYAKNKMFESISSDEDIFNCPIDFHYGCTFKKVDYDKTGKAVNVKVGNDYMHYGDEEFEDCETLEDAWKVKLDAEEIFKTLLEQQNEVTND